MPEACAVCGTTVRVHWCDNDTYLCLAHCPVSTPPWSING